MLFPDKRKILTIMFDARNDHVVLSVLFGRIRVKIVGLLVHFICPLTLSALLVRFLTCFLLISA